MDDSLNPSEQRPRAALVRDVVVVCEYCDAVSRRLSLERGERALCPCCGSPLYHHWRLGVDATLALAVAALVALIIANLYPIMTINQQGLHSSVTFSQSVMTVSGQGFVALAAVVAVVGFIAPLLHLGLLLAVCVPLRMGWRVRMPRYLLHALRHVRPWSMIEVLLLGALVATVKLAAIANVSAGPGLYAYGALTLCIAMLVADDPLRFWDWVFPCRE